MRSWCTITSAREGVSSAHVRARRRAFLATLFLFGSIALPVTRANAQGAIAGTVVAVGSQEPVPGAQVMLTGSTLRTTTDERGRFRFASVTGTTATLEVRRIGYKVAREPARVGDESVRVVLTLNPTSLEAVVVTGTAGAAQMRELGNSVGKINAADVVANSPIVSMQSLLNGRTAGLVVMPTAGTIGSGSQIRIRGQASLSLGNNPLLFVDGVRVNNQAASGPSSQAFGSSPISRLNDFNPEDIESIEVLKGPSAATLYGTEAANGVINIITKKGHASTVPRWNASVRQGVNYLSDWRTRFPTNYGKRRLTTDPVTGNASGPVEAVTFDSLLVGACGDSIKTRLGTKCDIYRSGKYQETDISVNGGVGLLNYYASGNLLDSEGAEASNSRRTYSGRLNVGFAATERFRIGANIGYVTGPTRLPCDAGCGGYTWTTLSATPNNYNLSNRHGFHSSLPYQYDITERYWQDLSRTTASLRLEHQPRSWLSQRLVFGGDVTREGNNYYSPRVDSLSNNGSRDITERDVTNRSLDYAANAIWNYRPTIRLTSSVGAQYFTESIHSVNAHGEIFPTGGLSSVSATTTNKTNSEGFSDDKSLGIYGQEQVGWRDRLYVTAALRSDDHSAFGESFSRVTYPKFSLSYVLSDEPWFRVPFVGDQLGEVRFRTAYGESGKAPTTYSSIRTYASTPGPGDSPAVTPNTTGNIDLGPEKGKEIEIGFDASALGDRIGVDFTYYNKKTVNAILDVLPAPSSGQANARPINVGGIVNRGIEVMVRGTPWRSDRVNVDVTANIATNHNEVTDLGLPGQYFVNAGTALRHQTGYPAFAWFEQRVVSTPFDRTTGFPQVGSQLYPVAVMCADTLANSNGKEGGPPRSCIGADQIWGSDDDAPNVYLGRSTPPREYSFSGTLTLFNRFRVFSLFDVKNGHRKLDGNTRVRCGIFGRCKENFDSIPATGFAAEVDSIRTAQARSNSNLIDFLIARADFGKWRELAVSYDVPDKYARMARTTRATISVSGRNLKTWTSYQGFEPEAMFLGGARGGNAAWEQTTIPQLTSWMVTVNFSF